MGKIESDVYIKKGLLDNIGFWEKLLRKVEKKIERATNQVRFTLLDSLYFSKEYLERQVDITVWEYDQFAKNV